MSDTKGKGREISVAVVEDNAALRVRLEKLLGQGGEFRCVGAYASGEEAIRLVPQAGPEVVLMDLNLPGISGIETTVRLKAAQPGLNILVLTVYSDSDNIFNALKAGACGYLLKRASTAEILDAIREVAMGGAPMSGEIARKVVSTFHGARMPDPAEDLSDREREILGLLCQGFANKEIAAKVFISVDTVRFHLKKIYEKLHVRSRTEAMAKFMGGGGLSER